VVRERRGRVREGERRGREWKKAGQKEALRRDCVWR